jgi:hypothetical protein
MDTSPIQGSVAFSKLLLRYESLLITSASWVIIQTLKKCLTAMASSPVFARLEPFLPIAVSVGAAFLPSFRLGTWDETLLYGVILGSMTGLGQKVLKQSLLGQDYRIRPVIEDPELRKKIDEHLQARGLTDGDGRSRKRLREKIRHLIT